MNRERGTCRSMLCPSLQDRWETLPSFTLDDRQGMMMVSLQFWVLPARRGQADDSLWNGRPKTKSWETLCSEVKLVINSWWVLTKEKISQCKNSFLLMDRWLHIVKQPVRWWCCRDHYIYLAFAHQFNLFQYSVSQHIATTINNWCKNYHIFTFNMRQNPPKCCYPDWYNWLLLKCKIHVLVYFDFNSLAKQYRNKTFNKK